MATQMNVAVITGASTGIGQATKQLLRERGCTVYNLDVLPTDDDAPDQYLTCDVRSRQALFDAVHRVKERAGRIDLLFANAGVHHVATVEDTTEEALDRVIDINIKGVFYTLQAVVPLMRAQGKGSIVLMGSDQCHVGKGRSAVYGLTKGAIGQLTKSTAIDLAPHGIRVNCICPGSIDTPLLHGAVRNFVAATGATTEQVMQAVQQAQPIQRLGTPQEIACAVAFMLSDEASFMTGALMSVDGGYVCQ